MRFSFAWRFEMPSETVLVRKSYKIFLPRYIRRQLKKEGLDIDPFPAFPTTTTSIKKGSKDPLDFPPRTVDVTIPGVNLGQPLQYSFLFWSATGSRDVEPVYPYETAPGMVPLCAIGDVDVDVTAWYGSYGSGPGTDGIILDAFDLDLGTHVDDDFVAVKPDAVDPGSVNANNGGLNTDWPDGGLIESRVVPAAERRRVPANLPHLQTSCTLTAYPHIASTGAAFDKWQIFRIGVEPVNGGTIRQDKTRPDTLDVERTAEAFAFAYYQKPSTIVPDLFGNTKELAEKTLQEANLVLGKVSILSSKDVLKPTTPDDHVVFQWPEAGSVVLHGESVDVSLQKLHLPL
jgi:hypothetical protein